MAIIYQRSLANHTAAIACPKQGEDTYIGDRTSRGRYVRFFSHPATQSSVGPDLRYGGIRPRMEREVLCKGSGCAIEALELSAAIAVDGSSVRKCWV